MDSAIVEFRNENSGFHEEIEVPLSITADDLICALCSAYELPMDQENVRNRYLCTQNPIAFLHGTRTLAEYGIRNGSAIIYCRHGT